MTNRPEIWHDDDIDPMNVTLLADAGGLHAGLCHEFLVYLIYNFTTFLSEKALEDFIILTHVNSVICRHAVW